MGLDELGPFDPREKIIEYKIEAATGSKLADYSIRDFMDETASESPAPGGGSISAYIGALGTSLGTMVANLSSHKRGWDEKWEYYSDWAEKGKIIQDKLLILVDEDTKAFKAIMEAYALPKASGEENDLRTKAILEATILAIKVPMETMRTAFESFDLLEAMIESGNPNSITDAGVGAVAVRSCILGAHLNVLINSRGLENNIEIEKLKKEAEEIARHTKLKEEFLLGKVYYAMNNQNK